jgi:hypothetical protein
MTLQDNVILQDWTRPKFEFLIELKSGRVMSRRPRQSGPVDGIIKRGFGRRAILIYKQAVLQGGAQIILQTGLKRLVLSDSDCRVQRQAVGGRIVQRLRVGCNGDEVTLWDVAVTRPIVSLFDPAHDKFDEAAEDFGAFIGELVTDSRMRRHLLTTWGVRSDPVRQSPAQ